MWKCERMCVCTSEAERKICFIIFLLRRASFSLRCIIYLILSTKSSEGHKLKCFAPFSARHYNQPPVPVSVFSDKSLICYVIQWHRVPLSSIHTQAQYTKWCDTLAASEFSCTTLNSSCVYNKWNIFKLIGAHMFPPLILQETKQQNYLKLN